MSDSHVNDTPIPPPVDANGRCTGCATKPTPTGDCPCLTPPRKSERYDRPVSVHDLDECQTNLAAVAELATQLAPHLPDLYSLAYERRVGERVLRAGQADGYALTDVGIRRAKYAIADVVARSDQAIAGLAQSLHTARNLLTAGSGPDETLKGTLLGDRAGNGAVAEHTRLRESQRLRWERGEYTPHRVEDQPTVPGTPTGKGKAKKKKRKR